MISVGKFVRFIESSKIGMVHHFLMNKKLFPKDFPFFIEIFPEQYIPYFIDYTVKKEQDIFEIKIQENLSMRIDKEIFLQKELFLREKDFLEYASFYSPLRYLEFQIFDKNDNLMGVFKSIFEYKNKWCMRILTSENEEMFVYLYDKTIEKTFLIENNQKKLILL